MWLDLREFNPSRARLPVVHGHHDGSRDTPHHRPWLGDVQGCHGSSEHGQIETARDGNPPAR